MRRCSAEVLGIAILIGSIGAALDHGGRLSAQTATESAGAVLGAGNFIHVVADVDKSQAFYQDVIGLEAQAGRGGAAAPAPAERPWITNRPDILRLYNAASVSQYRNGGAGVPEQPMRVETMEIGDPARQAVHPRFQDPGAATIVLTVRNLDAVLARVKQNNIPIVTIHGGPVSMNAPDGGLTRAVMVKDPDGFFVELVQRALAAPTTAPPERNVIDVGFAFTVSDTDRMTRVFRDALGFHLVSSNFSTDQALQNLTGVSGGQVRRTSATIPGSSTRIELFEFKGVDRKAVPQSTTRDPGSPVLRLRVKDTNEMIQRLAAVGVKVTSTGGEPVDVAGNAASQRFAITSAPDNLFIQVVQQIPQAPRAPQP